MVRAVGMWSGLILFTQGTARLSTVLTPTPKTEESQQGVSQEKVKGGIQAHLYGPWRQLGPALSMR